MNPVKLPSKRRTATVLGARQPSCMEEAPLQQQQAPRSHREPRLKAGAAAPSCSSTDGRNGIPPSSKALGNDKERGNKAKVKSNKHKLSKAVGPMGSSSRTGPPPSTEDRGAGLERLLTVMDSGLSDGLGRLTDEQLQQILFAIQRSSYARRGPEEQEAPGAVSHSNLKSTECKPQHVTNCETDTNCSSAAMEGELKEKEEDVKKEEDRCGRSPEFERLHSDNRTTVNSKKKAPWKPETDEQVSLKQQQRSALSRLQGKERAETASSSISHREQPAAIRSSLRLGEVTPMEEELSAARKEEQRRRWLEELDRQREEAAERRKREKLLRRQTEDHERWTAHFDSLQRRALIQPAAPSAPPAVRLSGSEREDWDPSSSLSLVWEATSSCGAESVIGASVDSTRGCPTRSSYLRTMTSLLDPAQIEERERRRLKQLEQQRAIEAQMEERKKQREQEEARRRRQEEEEEKRVTLEREKLQKQYELEMLKKKEKDKPPLTEEHQHPLPQPFVQPHRSDCLPQTDGIPHSKEPEENLAGGRPEETGSESTAARESERLESGSRSLSAYKDTYVQTEDAPPLPPLSDQGLTSVVSRQNLPPPSGSAEPPNSWSHGVRGGKENLCLPAGGDLYEPFARMERNRKTKRRPEWNTQRPSRRFVPASERYPVALQKNRQESRLRRQAELLALQERTRLCRTEPPAQSQEAGPCGPVKKIPAGLNGPGQNQTASGAERSRFPDHHHGAALTGPLSEPETLLRVSSRGRSPPPAQDFLPYLRTDEVLSLDPLEPTDMLPPPGSGVSVPTRSDPLPHTQRQQQILRGLARLRQGLLQKQRELETDLVPQRNRRVNERRLPSTAHRT
ncbi:coiled-coil domain-containing protein 66 isoform X3 [Cyprinodon tularosa]|uniref:coiled-coil domain-containing protein 66 isoform X3 n=1 Tax=Cyprinodon tularosa TaxID=77115 RepID=UPI0018E20361|nr:coiled-coil domain-containing protein 66 isoform X3 [Cyprinodon tularosa]